MEQCEAVPFADTESHGALFTFPLGLHSPPAVGRHADRPTIHAGPLVVPTSGESFCHVHLAPVVSLHNEGKLCLNATFCFKTVRFSNG